MSGEPPVKITIPSGAGVPGKFKGLNYRLSAAVAAAASNAVLNKAFSGASAEAIAAVAAGTATEAQKAEAAAANPNEAQQIAELKALPPAEKARLAKGGGCGMRRANQTSIFKPPTTALSSSLSASAAVSASSAAESASRAKELKKWEDRNALLAKAGIKETDDQPPTDVDVDEWRVIVGTFK